MFEDFLKVLICPNTKEKLSIISRKELTEISRKENVELPKGEYFLINESGSFLYPISKYGFPILLPEQGIALKIFENSIPALSKNNTSISFDTLKNHQKNLENVYRKDDYITRCAGHSMAQTNYQSVSLHKPMSEYLKPGSVLDGGCGVGFFRRFTRGRFHLMVDVSEVNLSYNFHPYKVIGRTESLPVSDNSFDNVVSFRSLEHCQDVQTSISELARCLKPGGRFLVGTWRHDWPSCLKGTPWAITNFLYFLEKAFLLAKRNPSLFFDRFFFKLKLKKTKKDELAIFWDKDNKKNFTRRFKQNEFQTLLENVGLKILKKGYSGKEFPGPLPPPKFITDRYFDSSKYGLFLFFVCEKPL